MITSIVVTGKYKIGMNSNRKIMIGDTVLSVDKEIPFVRYRFNEYTDAEYDYIKNMMNQFNASTHLAEVQLSDETANVINTLKSEVGNIAKYVYINISNEDVAASSVSAEALQNFTSLMAQVVEKDIDRVMLKDNTDCLDTVTAKKMIKQLCQIGKMPESKVGVCSSPLSFGDWACLTAVKARELMSMYSTISDVALPSANHQCMNCCGCIRYFTVTEDTLVPSDGKVKKVKENSNSSEKTSSKTKVSKPRIVVGMNNL